jgi:hypothetical protein
MGDPGRVPDRMTQTGLATPRRPAPPRVPPSAASPQPVVRVAARDRASFERIFGWSLGISVGLHLLFLLLSPFLIQTHTPPAGSPLTEAADPDRFGLEMIVAIPSENAPELLPPPRERAPERSLPVPPAAAPPSGPQAGAATPAPAPAPAEPSVNQGAGGPREGFQPGFRDPRFYVPPPPPVSPDNRTDHQRYMDHLQARIDAVNDSLGLEARRNQPPDWTVRDGSGNRWGLSSDGLHLGGVTIPRALIPSPRPTGDNQNIEAQRERDRQREEIRRQADEAQRRETRDERIDATRRQRDEQRSGGGS